jgi:hypothetical protein
MSEADFSFGLSTDQFGRVFPFHFVFDLEGRLVQFGKSLARLCPDIESGKPLTDFFTLRHPGFPAAEFLEQLIIVTAGPGRTPLRGQLLRISEEPERIAFLGSP